jgi:hypothetical protein
MSFLPYPPTTVGEAINVFKQDVEILHDIIHGDDTQDVLTENGTVPSVEKLFSEIIAKTSWVTAAGSFELGGTITERNQVLRRDSDGFFFSWGGELPKIVPASSTVAGTGGEGVTAWTNRNDATFASQLAAADSPVLVGGVEAGKTIVPVTH